MIQTLQSVTDVHGKGYRDRYVAKNALRECKRNGKLTPVQSTPHPTAVQGIGTHDESNLMSVLHTLSLIDYRTRWGSLAEGRGVVISTTYDVDNGRERHAKVAISNRVYGASRNRGVEMAKGWNK